MASGHRAVFVGPHNHGFSSGGRTIFWTDTHAKSQSVAAVLGGDFAGQEASTHRDLGDSDSDLSPWEPSLLWGNRKVAFIAIQLLHYFMKLHDNSFTFHTFGFCCIANKLLDKNYDAHHNDPKNIAGHMNVL